MEVDPAFYVTHVVFFLWGAVLFGFYVQSLVAEVRLRAWAEPRCLWAAGLCLSSGVFVINYFDPRTILGLYPANILKFIEWVNIITISSSFGFSAYIYLTALYRRNMKVVPTCLRNVWLVLMVTCSLIHAVFSIIGASTGNMYWFGVDGLILAAQEILMTLGLNISICKLTRYLNQLNQEKHTLGATSVTNFEAALRKMKYVGVGSTLLLICALIFQVGLPGSGALDRIARPFTPILYDNRTFQGLGIVSPCLACGIHSLFLYMLRRPQPKSEKSSEKTREMSASPQPASSRLSALSPSTNSAVERNSSDIQAPSENKTVERTAQISSDIPIVIAA